MSYAVVSQPSNQSRKRSFGLASAKSYSLSRRRRTSVNAGGYTAIGARIRSVGIPRSIREHKFVRSVSTNNGSQYGTSQQIAIIIDQNRGFVVNGSVQGSYNMALTFSLTGMNLWFNGTYYGTISIPGASDFTALYEQYKIEAVDVQFYFSGNTSAATQAVTCLPIMGICRDFDDVLGTDMFAVLK